MNARIIEDYPRVTRVNQNELRVIAIERQGPQGAPGAIGGTVPWTNITGIPDLVEETEATPATDWVLLFENQLA
jgi:hypothetical protein